MVTFIDLLVLLLATWSLLLMFCWVQLWFNHAFLYTKKTNTLKRLWALKKAQGGWVFTFFIRLRFSNIVILIHSCSTGLSAWRHSGAIMEAWPTVAWVLLLTTITDWVKTAQSRDFTMKDIILLHPSSRSIGVLFYISICLKVWYWIWLNNISDIVFK